MARSTQQDHQALNTDTDRYLAPVKALRRLVEVADFPQASFEVLEIRSTAAGELTWRIREPRAEEVDIGYLGPE